MWEEASARQKVWGVVRVYNRGLALIWQIRDEFPEEVSFGLSLEDEEEFSMRRAERFPEGPNRKGDGPEVRRSLGQHRN